MVTVERIVWASIMREHKQDRSARQQAPAFDSDAPSRSSDWEQVLTARGMRKECSLSPGRNHPTRRQYRNAEDGFVIFTAGECSSSMDLAWQLVNEELLPPWGSVLVASQSSGRGRFGRHWHSPAGNLYASLRLPLLDAAWRDLVPLLLGAGVVDVLSDPAPAARIKWPNDIIVGYKKVGGILIEERDDTIVAGVGLNLVSSPSSVQMRSGCDLPAGCLTDFGVNMSPPDLWIRLVRHIRSGIRETTAKLSQKEFLENLEVHMAYVGETVVLSTPNEENRPATLVGLDAGGGIRVRTSAGEQVFCYGTIYSASGK